MVKDKENFGGYQTNREKLIETSKISIEGRLRWLEEANKFLALISDPELKKKWKLFRKINLEAN